MGMDKITDDDVEVWVENPVTVKFMMALRWCVSLDVNLIAQEILGGDIPSQEIIQSAAMKAEFVNRVSSLNLADLKRLLNEED
jgi:hypothetical protein